MSRIVELIFKEWKKQGIVSFKEDEKTVFARALRAVEEDFVRESKLDAEVHRMVEDLERQHGGQFQRSKMFHMIKQKLANERKIPL